MDLQRNIFLMIFLFISFILWQTWEKEHKIQQKKIEQKKVILTKESELTQEDLSCKNNYIIVKTDVFLLKINKIGGNIEQAFLLKYKKNLGSKHPLCLLATFPNYLYKTENFLTFRINNKNLSYIEQRNVIFSSEKQFYYLQKNENTLHVTLKSFNKNGIRYNKKFIFYRNEYLIKIFYEILNNSKDTLEATLTSQIRKTIHEDEDNNRNENFMLHTYKGTAFSTLEKKYKKYNFEEIQKENLNIFSKIRWIAMLQQYFVVACIPDIQINHLLYTNVENNQAIIGFKTSPIFIFSNDCKKIQSNLWIGPKIMDLMSKASPYLDLTIDYGWLWFISKPLFQFLKFIHFYVENWGISIILITLIVKVIMYPLTKSQYVSMAKMHALQPKILEIRLKYEHNRQKQSQEIISLYKKEKINPFGGCFPILIQMPIFLALYYMLSSSIELRHAPFIFWIKDLSSKDPYYILPIIMGITTFVVQKTSISSNSSYEPTQQKIMNIMPVVFTIFFLWFPSGLVLYYTFSNVITIIQQKIIYKSINTINV